MTRSSKEQLAQNLGRTIEKDVGMAGLQTMIYGWLRYRRYGRKYRKAIANRDWLYITEVQDLSDYVGYNLAVFPS